MSTQEIIRLLSTQRFPVDNEKECQVYIEKMFMVKGVDFTREYRLDEKNIPDFFDEKTGLAIEVKIKGSIMDIFRQANEQGQGRICEHARGA